MGDTWEPEVAELRHREGLARRMGGPEKVQRQHDGGKLTVRERIEKLLDPGSFHEIGAIAGRASYDDDGRLLDLSPTNFVMGRGRIDGRAVVVGGDDFTVRGGAADASIWQKQVHAEQMAGELRIPIVRLVDGTGGGGSVKSLDKDRRTYVPANPGWNTSLQSGRYPYSLAPFCGRGEPHAWPPVLLVMCETRRFSWRDIRLYPFG